MRNRTKSAIAGAAALAVLSAGLIAVGPNALASSGTYTPATPPWVSQLGSSLVGGVNLYNSSGSLVTGGNDWRNLSGVAYVGATGATGARTGATAASLYLYFPNSGNSIPATWDNTVILGATAFTTQTLTPAPAGVTGSAGQFAVATGTNFDSGSPTPISDAWSGNASPSTTAGYDHVLELRLIDNGPGLGSSTNVWAVDILFNDQATQQTYNGVTLAAGEWTVVYPVSSLQATSVSQPVPSLVSPQDAGTQITLTSTTSVPGAVQFTQDGTNIGSPVTTSVVSGEDTAVSAPITLTPGDHTFAASFTPTDTSAYSGSSSTDLAYSVNGTPTNVTTPTPSVAGPVDPGTAITLSSTVTPAVAGTIRFKDNGANITGVSPVTVDVGGAATSPSFTPAAGPHSFTALFTPSDPLTYQPSTSTALSFSVNATLPVNSAVPVVSGTVAAGRVVSCTNGTWTNSPVTYTYAWYLAGGVSAFSVAQQVTLSGSLAGKSIYCKVTAANASGSATASSAAKKVALGTWVARIPPTMTGSTRVGGTLTANPGRWSPATTTFRYMWKRGSVVVSKARSYRLTAKDRGQRITCYVMPVKVGWTPRYYAAKYVASYVVPGL